MTNSNDVNCNVENNPLLLTFEAPYEAIPFDQIKLEHYVPAFHNAIQRHDAEINEIFNNQDTPTFKNSIEALEQSGRLLSRISSVFFNLHSAETCDQMQQIAEYIAPILTEHANNISLNAALFQRIKFVYDQRKTLNLNIEQQTLLQKTYDSFVDNGANLSDSDQVIYRQLTQALEIESLTFDRHLLKEINDYTLIVTDRNLLSGLSVNYLESAAEKAKQKGKEGWLFDLTAPSYIPAMKFLDNRELRQELYMAYCTKCNHDNDNDNKQVISHIVNLRLQIANLLGYNTYAEYALKDRMAENSCNVYHLLNDLLEAYKPKALNEIKEVESYARNNEFTSDLLPWDWPYYAEKLKNEQYSFNEDLLRPYFELSHVISGVFGLATKLYGITFEEMPEIPVYHEDVKVFKVNDQNGDYLALLYIDFFPRPGKRSGAWMTEYKNQWIDGGGNSRPHISLVMNFTKPTSTKPALLTFDEVTTFLHEFGHALHGILSDTTYSSLSGTNVYRDFVECPSQFMEYYATENEFLDDFAIHFQTKEKISPNIITQLKASKNYNVGYQCIRQLNFGFVDMAWHMITCPLDEDVVSFEKMAEQKTLLFSPITSTSVSTSFGHIFSGGYAAGYYSYKWAEVLAADTFAAFKDSGLFNKATSNAFRKHVLSQGGTEKPMELYLRFRGKKPDISALLVMDGLDLRT